MRHLIVIIILLVSAHAHSQSHWQMHPDIPKDTSFTVYQEYQKQKATYPFINIVRQQIPEGVTEHADMVYTQASGRDLHLDVYQPEGKEMHPAVILIHGGGWRSGDKSLQKPMAQHLAARGYVTATVEYRMSMEAQYPAAVQDVKTAIRWIKDHAKEYQIDTTKIGVLGCSAGGQLAALVGVTGDNDFLEGEKGEYLQHTNTVQAIVDIDGVLAFIHPESGEGQDKPGSPSAGTLWFGGNSQEVPELWQEASALNYVDAQTPPSLFINSSYPRFHAGRDDMMTKMDSLGIYAEKHTIPKTPHPFWLFHPWFDQTIDWVSAFLDKTLKDNP